MRSVRQDMRQDVRQDDDEHQHPTQFNITLNSTSSGSDVQNRQKYILSLPYDDCK